jgi:NAD-dependent SIR2 family protein deacetylase
MGNKFSSGKHSIAECDRCGFRYKLKELRELTIKTKKVNIKVCNECWEEDHPQLQVGMYPVEDPQAVRQPRPDLSYYGNGNNGAGGSRMIQWGWNPVGGARANDNGLTPNTLVAQGAVGTVTVVIS